MLQQTTSKAVIPHFERFIQKFPHLKSLSLSKEEDVLELWSGLGYYRRAKNLPHAAREFLKFKEHFKRLPHTHKELIKVKGIGTYTSRAISSQAFGEKVGVLDGNTIRLFCRKEALSIQWWKEKEKKKLQNYADQCVQFEFEKKGKKRRNDGTNQALSGEINQALMELGSTICLPKNPLCILCPWQKSCKAFKENSTEKFPLKKIKPKEEFWAWFPLVYKKNDQNQKQDQIQNQNQSQSQNQNQSQSQSQSQSQIQDQFAFIKNDYAPFLKKEWIFPGRVIKLKRKPKHFDFNHTITHRHLFVTVKNSHLKEKIQNKEVQGKSKNQEIQEDQKVQEIQEDQKVQKVQKEKPKLKWLSRKEIKRHTPFSLIQKTLHFS